MNSQSTRGFTLVETIVVLALIALVTSIVFPNFTRLYDSTVLGSQKEDILGQIGDLGFRAYIEGRRFELTNLRGGDAQAVVAVPDGWVVSTLQPVIYKVNGVCLGGEVTLSTGVQQETFMLKAPYCKPEKKSNAGL